MPSLYFLVTLGPGHAHGDDRSAGTASETILDGFRRGSDPTTSSWIPIRHTCLPRTAPSPRGMEEHVTRTLDAESAKQDGNRATRHCDQSTRPHPGVSRDAQRLW